MTTNDTAITALQHIAAGHTAVCPLCGWMGPPDQADYVYCVSNKCPHCGERNRIKYGADEIAAYALRQVGGGE